MSDPLDILTENLEGVDTSIPLINAGLYSLAVKEIKDEPSNDGTKTNLNIKLVTRDVARSTKGEDVPAGFPLFHTISLSPSDKYTPDAIKRKVAQFTQAIGVKSVKPYSDCENKIVMAEVVIDPERTDKNTGKKYEPRNSIKAFLING